MYGIPTTERSLVVEVQLTSINQGSQFVFPDNQIIRGQNIMVYGFEAYTSSTVSKTPSGNSLVTDNGASGLTLNFLDDKSINLVNQIPYNALNTYLLGGVVREFKPFRMVLQKSFVSISDSTSLTINQSILLNILYKPV
jgi:hypothetical protein